MPIDPNKASFGDTLNFMQRGGGVAADEGGSDEPTSSEEATGNPILSAFDQQMQAADEAIEGNLAGPGYQEDDGEEQPEEEEQEGEEEQAAPGVSAELRAHLAAGGTLDSYIEQRMSALLESRLNQQQQPEQEQAPAEDDFDAQISQRESRLIEIAEELTSQYDPAARRALLTEQVKLQREISRMEVEAERSVDRTVETAHTNVISSYVAEMKRVGITPTDDELKQLRAANNFITGQNARGFNPGVAQVLAKARAWDAMIERANNRTQRPRAPRQDGSTPPTNRNRQGTTTGNDPVGRFYESDQAFIDQMTGRKRK